MANYYVNKNAEDNGDYEVHSELCVLIPEQENRVYLGGYDNCDLAIKDAKEYYSNAKGCSYCCSKINRSLV